MGSKSNSKTARGGKQNGSKSNGNKLQSQETRTVKEQIGDTQTDYSMLRKPIDISVNGVSQVVKVYQTATAEVRQLLAYECDLVYECRVCRNLFRSLANFLSHKRVYCRDQFSDTKHAFPTNHLIEDRTTVIQPEPVPLGPCKETWVTSDVTPDPTTVMGSLDTGDGELLQPRIETSVPPITKCSNTKRDLSQIVERLAQKRSVKTITETMGHISASKFYETISGQVAAQRDATKEHVIRLEAIENTKYGVFQTVLQSNSTVQMENTDLMKAQVVELHNMMSCNEATLGPDGQIAIMNGEGTTRFSLTASNEGNNASPIKKQDSPQSNKLMSFKENHVCNICNTRFSTRKTLNHHMKSLHVTFRICYPCPCCKNTFCNTWSVYRHLYKVHRKTTLQVRKLRSQIVNKAFRKEVPVCESKNTIGKSTSLVMQTEADKVRKEQQRLHQENQAWMNSFEDDLELQMCGGCGRRFERRAALSSHSQICQKRIAVQNNIKARRTSPSISSTSPSSRISGTKVSPSPTEIALSESCASGVKGIAALSPSPVPLDVMNQSAVQLLPSSSGVTYHRTRHCSGSRDSTKKDIPEKRIEIQIRRDYCKTGTGNVNHLIGVAGFPHQQDFNSEMDEKIPSCDDIECCNEDGINSFDADSSNRTCRSRESDIEVSRRDPLLFDENSDLDMCSLKETVEQNFKKEGESTTDGANANPVEVPRRGSGNTEMSSMKSESNVNCTDDTHVEKQVAAAITSTRKIGKDSTSPVTVSESGELRYEMLGDRVLKAAPPTRIKKEEQFSPVMENRMQNMINIRRLQCLPCQKKFNKLTNLRRHVAVHIGWNRYRCIECTFKCFSKYDCVAHVNKMHLGNKEREKAQTMVEYIESQVSDIEGDSNKLDPTEEVDDVQDDQSVENVERSVVSRSSSRCENIDNKTKDTELAKLLKGEPLNAVLSDLELFNCDENATAVIGSNNYATDAAVPYGTEDSQIKQEDESPLQVTLEEKPELQLAAKQPVLPSTDDTTKTVTAFKKSVKGNETGDKVSSSVLEVASGPVFSLRSRRKRRLASSESLDVDYRETVLSKKLLTSAEYKQNVTPADSKDVEENDALKSKAATSTEMEKNVHRGLSPTSEEADELEKEDPSLPEVMPTQTQLRKMVLEVIFGTNSNTSQDAEATHSMFSTVENGECARSETSTSSSEPYDVVEVVSSDSASPLTTNSSAASPSFTSDDTASVMTENSPTKDENKNGRESKTESTTSSRSETERRQRPVRNRVRVEREDFIYDLSDKCLDPKRDGEERSKMMKRKQQEDRVRESVKLPDRADTTKTASKITLKSNTGEYSGVKTVKTGNNNAVIQGLDTNAARNSSPNNVGYNISTRKSQRTFDLTPHKVPFSNKEKSD